MAWEIASRTAEGGPDGAGGFSDALAGAYGGASLTVCFGGGNRQGPIDQAACLTARGHKCDFEVETFAAQSVTGERTHALNTANGGKGSSEDGTGRGVPIVAHSVAFAQNSGGEVRLEAGHGHIAGTLNTGGGKPGYGMPAIACRGPEQHPFPTIAFSAKDYGGDALDNIAPTLRAGVRLDRNPNGGVMPAIAFRTLQATFHEHVSRVLTSRYKGEADRPETVLGPNLVARSVALRGRDGGATIEVGDGIANALRASSGGGDKAHVLLPSTEDYFHGQMLGPDETGWSQWAGWRVRRLMPVECERLQGMPDNYTLVPYRGKLAADGPRYKAVGNSMAVPCVEWLGRRIALVLATREA